MTTKKQSLLLVSLFEALYRGFILQSKEHTQNTRISASELNSNSLTSKAQKQKKIKNKKAQLKWKPKTG